MSRKIIIAESDRVLREGYKKIFPHGNIVAEIFPDAQTLVEKVRHGKYDLGVIGYSMESGITGLEAVGRIRSFNRQIPLIFCSGTHPIREKALEAGATGIINKNDLLNGNNFNYFLEKIKHYLV